MEKKKPDADSELELKDSTKVGKVHYREGGGASSFHYSYMSALCFASYSGHSVFVGYSSTTLRDHQFVNVWLKTKLN